MNKPFSAGTARITLLVILSSIYAATIALDYTWMHRGADGADFMIAAATNGVAHPTGYPTYLILARLFQLIPIGSLAFRTNLLSAVTMLLAAVVIFEIIRQAAKEAPAYVPLLGGLSFGLAPLIWSQALITEVYGLHTLCIVLLLWLSQLDQPAKKHHILGGILAGLSLGNHITTIFILPYWLLRPILEKQADETLADRFKLHLPSLLQKIVWLSTSTVAIYATIFWRARSGSPVNWGYAVDFSGFWWLVSGQYYQVNLDFSNLATLFGPFANNLRTFVSQFNWLLLFLGLSGAEYAWNKARRLFWGTLWVFLAYFLFSAIYASDDSYTLLTNPIAMVSIWVSLSIPWLTARLTDQRKKWTPLLLTLVFGSLALSVFLAWPQLNARHDTEALDYATTVFEQAPPNAIIFTLDDKDTFSLWYAHFILGQRPDVKIFILPMVELAWYRHVVGDTYPTLTIPNTPDDFWLEGVTQYNPDLPYCTTELTPPILTCYP